MPLSIRRWIYVVPGFTQTRGSRTRLIDLWARLHHRHSDSHTVVSLLPWKADWKSEAEFVLRLSVAIPLILVAAYSWGAGWGFVRFAKELKHRGLSVRHAWLIDPVYRHPYWLGQWRALIPWWSVKIPNNVQHVTWWRQKQSIPRGHDLIADRSKTLLEPPQEISVDHIHADDHLPVMEEVYRQIGEELHA